MDFESSEVCNLLGIKPFYLNKFVERGQFAIRPSATRGKGRGSRRRYTEDDVFAVALVWWLFEGGLRSKTIDWVLRQLAKTEEADARLAARRLMDKQVHALVVSREPRDPTRLEASAPKQRVYPVTRTQVTDVLREDRTATLHIIPVGNLYAGLMERMKDFLEKA